MGVQDLGLRLVVVGGSAAQQQLGAFNSDITSAEAKIRLLASSSMSLGERFTKLGSVMSNLGRTMTLGITVPILGTSAALNKSGIEFEDAFAGVLKTVENTSVGFKELAVQMYGTSSGLSKAQKEAVFTNDAFGTLKERGKEIRDEFRKMALEIPISAVELANLGEEAGQLGIKESEISDFVKTMAMLGTATNVSASEAGNAIARLANIMGISSDQMSEFALSAGSAIVALGNESAATESEIINMAYRISGAGQAIDLTTQEILALSTSVSELGVRAEAGGTAVSRILLEMGSAATGASDSIDLFAQAAGLTVDEFKNLIKTSPLKAFELLVGGLSDMQEAGTLTSDTLAELGLNSVRLRDVINRLGPNMENLTSNVDLANSAWIEQIALEEEARKKYKTVAAQLTILKNAFDELGIVVFDLFRNEIVNMIDTFKKVILTISETNSETLRFVAKIALIAAAIGPVLVALGTMIQMVGFATTGLATFGALIAPLLVPLGLLAAPIIAFGVAWQQNVGNIQTVGKDVIKTLADIAYWIGQAFSYGMSLPGANIFTGISQAIKALTYIYKDGERTFFGNFFKSLGMAEDKANSLGMVIRNKLNPVLYYLSTGFKNLGMVVNVVFADLVKRGPEQALRTLFMGGLINRIVSGFGFEKFGNPIQDLFKNMFVGIEDILVPIKEIFGSVGSIITGILLPAFVSFGSWFINEFAPPMIDLIANGLIPYWTVLVESLLDFANAVLKKVLPDLKSLYEWFTKKIGPGLSEVISGTIIPALKLMINIFTEVWRNVYPVLINLFEIFYDIIHVGIEIAIKSISTSFKVFQVVAGLVGDVLDELWKVIGPSVLEFLGWFADKATAAWKTINDLGNIIRIWLIPAIKALWEDTKEFLNALYNWFMTSGLQKIKDFIAGPFTTTLFNIVNAINNIWDSTKDKLNTFKNWFLNIGANLSNVPTAMSDLGNRMYESVMKPLLQIPNRLIKILNDAIPNDINMGILGSIDMPDNPIPYIPGFPVPAYAKGGRISGAGIVGDRGAELFMPKSAGTVIPGDLIKSIVDSVSSPIIQNTSNVNRNSTFSPTIYGAAIKSEQSLMNNLYNLYNISKMVT